MTATLTANELITTALDRLNEAGIGVCLLGDLLTPEQRHPILNDLAAIRLALLTPPLRPEEMDADAG